MKKFHLLLALLTFINICYGSPTDTTLSKNVFLQGTTRVGKTNNLINTNYVDRYTISTNTCTLTYNNTGDIAGLLGKRTIIINKATADSFLYKTNETLITVSVKRINTYVYASPISTVVSVTRILQIQQDTVSGSYSVIYIRSEEGTVDVYYTTTAIGSLISRGTAIESNTWNYDGNSVTSSDFLGTTNSAKLFLKTKSTTALTVDTSQQVGIGTVTPSAKFQVAGSALVDSLLTFGSSDSATIYAIAPTKAAIVYCSNCSGNAVTGRLLMYIGAAWRRISLSLTIN